MADSRPPRRESGQLPNGERAQVDIRKLTDYCLNPDHPRGRHKARVFRDALGLALADAAEFQSLLLAAAREEAATLMDADQWGQRWRVDVANQRQNRTGVVRTIWITRDAEDAPRFLTCWVL
ncbi:MAG: hypothetical protein JO107_17065 [Hyphomicrobiales bacterium]|nr:hypothetical protein [Hyphomicrobiales bacterium]